MIEEPDPTIPDPVAYLKACFEYARVKRREKLTQLIRERGKREVRVNG